MTWLLTSLPTLLFVLCSDYAVFSNFTLAFFEDSGWYQVNYTFINNYDQFELQWGRGMTAIWRSMRKSTILTYNGKIYSSMACTYTVPSNSGLKLYSVLNSCWFLKFKLSSFPGTTTMYSFCWVQPSSYATLHHCMFWCAKFAAHIWRLTNKVFVQLTSCPI